MLQPDGLVAHGNRHFRKSASGSTPLASWYAERFGTAHVSVTDESDIVAAFVVVETRS